MFRKKKKDFNLTKEDIKKGEERLKDGFDEAKDILSDKDRLDKLLESTERKLKSLPFGGKKFAIVPAFIQMIRSYVNKEYRDVPVGTILALISATAYFLSPVDFIPDFLPFVGFLDDAAVIAAALKWVSNDLDDYRVWRDSHKK